MKKNIYILLVTALVFNACKKENLLEDVEISNPYDGEFVDYITVEDVEKVKCDLLIIDFKVHEDRIPDSLNYSHILIKDENNVALKSKEGKNVYVETNCNGSTTLLITLYNDQNKNESLPSRFIYTP